MKKFFFFLVFLIVLQASLCGQTRVKVYGNIPVQNQISEYKTCQKVKALVNNNSREYVNNSEIFIPGKNGTGKAAPASTGYFSSTTGTRNYFRLEDNDNTLWNGKHWKPEDYPLKVYIKIDSNSGYRSSFCNYINYAFKLWHNADNRISFSYALNEQDAQIIIWFENNLMNKYEDEYLGLTNYETGKKKEIKKVVMEIGVHKYNNIRISTGEIKVTVIHELGHALGMGHSDNPNDIMFPYIDNNVDSKMNYKELSAADIAAIKSTVNLGGKDDNTGK